MTEDRQTLTHEDHAEELTLEQIEQVIGGDTGGGAGKVNVQDLAFTHYYDVATPRLT